MPSQSLLSGMGSVPVSAYRISMGVDVLDPRMILRMDLVTTSSFKRLVLLVDPYAKNIFYANASVYDHLYMFFP